jgi:putative pyruvate formate lyase activating enzyme
LGRLVDTDEIARICLALQRRGAENINIVTGSHAVPALVEGIAAARRGPAPGNGGTAGGPLSIPVLWNSSAYEVPETLELLSGTVEVFLPDLKTLDSALAEQYYNASNYPETAAAAIRKMLTLRRLRVEKWEGGTESMVSGVMVRHLVLPGHLGSTRKVLRWFAEHCAGQALLSLMFQYTDMAAVYPADSSFRRTGPKRRISEAEYHTVLNWLGEYGLEDGYCQDPPGRDPAADARWLPDFERTNPFSSELSTPVWHWREGFV